MNKVFFILFAIIYFYTIKVNAQTEEWGKKIYEAQDYRQMQHVEYLEDSIIVIGNFEDTLEVENKSLISRGGGIFLLLHMHWTGNY